MRAILRSLLMLLLACGPLAGCLTTTEAMKPKESPRAPTGLLANEKTAELQLTLAEELVRKGQGGAAIAELEKARENDPRLSAQVSRRLGVLYDLSGAPAKAM